MGRTGCGQWCGQSARAPAVKVDNLNATCRMHLGPRDAGIAPKSEVAEGSFKRLPLLRPTGSGPRLVVAQMSACRFVSIQLDYLYHLGWCPTASAEDSGFRKHQLLLTALLQLTWAHQNNIQRGLLRVAMRFRRQLHTSHLH